MRMMMMVMMVVTVTVTMVMLVMVRMAAPWISSRHILLTLTFLKTKRKYSTNLTNGPIVGAHAKVEAGRARRPRKLKWKLELVLLFNLELKLKLILLKLFMNPVLPKLVICVGADA